MPPGIFFRICAIYIFHNPQIGPHSEFKYPSFDLHSTLLCHRKSSPPGVRPLLSATYSHYQPAAWLHINVGIPQGNEWVFLHEVNEWVFLHEATEWVFLHEANEWVFLHEENMKGSKMLMLQTFQCGTRKKLKLVLRVTEWMKHIGSHNRIFAWRHSPNKVCSNKHIAHTYPTNTHTHWGSRDHAPGERLHAGPWLQPSALEHGAPAWGNQRGQVFHRANMGHWTLKVWKHILCMV